MVDEEEVDCFAIVFNNYLPKGSIMIDKNYCEVIRKF